MRILCFLLCCFPVILLAKISPADSLQTLLAHTQDPQKRVEICINQDDYYRYVLKRTSLSATYQLLDESIKAHNEYGISKALRRLVMAVDRRNRLVTHDSIVRYIKIAEKNLTGDWKKKILTEVNMRHIRSLVDWTEKEDKVIAEITKLYTTAVNDEHDIYSQIEHEYALGKVNSLMISDWTETINECLRYYDNLLILLEKLPVQYRTDLFLSASDNLFAAYFNAGKKEKAVEMLESMNSTIEQYKKLDFVKKEVYLNFDEAYSLYCEGMARSPEVIGREKAVEYLKKSNEMARRPDGYILTLYSTYKEHYRSLGDYRAAISYADSIMIAVQDSGFSEIPGVLSSTYKEQAGWYATLEDYKNAYVRILKYDSINLAMANADSKKMRQEMGVRYDVNQLELEKVQLESGNRRIALVAVLVILGLAVAWGIHQRVNLKKLQRVQKRLVESNKEVFRQSEKAQESENMKTAFINSMCHEIRTPLNSINGFSSILLDETIDNELKQEFPELIQQSTYQLTCLINDLLEVSSLDSSDEKLPIESMDVHVMLKQEIDQLKLLEGKADIDYRLEMEDEECIIHTHILYLTRVITNLLNNANKFTKKGHITLVCQKDCEKQILTVTITDTGIGIPADKRNWVFERFTKVDEFKPGTGLGLYVCRLIMNRLHGTIQIDPEYTGGTKFILSLPL